MSMLRRLVLGACACGALALPAVGFAQSRTPAQTSPTTAAARSNEGALDCDRVCAERARTAAANQARVRVRRAKPATVATMHIDTRVSRDVSEGCRYVADAVGQYRGVFLSNAPDGKLRDVHLAANTALSCNGHVVRRQTQRWDLPITTRRELTQAMHDRLAIQVPGSSCEFSSNYGFQGGNLLARGADSSCPHNAEISALRSYVHPMNVRGGGPIEPTSNDARIGSH